MSYVEAVVNRRTGGIVKRDEEASEPITLEPLRLIRQSDLHVKKDTPLLRLEGTESGAKTFAVKEATGALVIANETDGVDELKVDVGAGEVVTPRNVRISKDVPGVRLSGTETDGKDWTIRENAGFLELYDNAAGALADDVPLKQDIRIEKDVPAVRLRGTESGAKDLAIRENAGRIEVYDVGADASQGYLNPQPAGKRIATPLCKQISEISTTSTSPVEIDRCYGWLSSPPTGWKPRIALICEAYNNGGATVTVRAYIGGATAEVSTTATAYETLSAIVDADTVDDWLVVEYFVSGATGFVRNLTAMIIWETA